MSQQLDILSLTPDPDKIEIVVDALVARQPIGDIITASMPYRRLIQIAYFDVRRLVSEKRDVEQYLGIQRPLIPSRVSSLQDFVNFADATFPTAVIIAIEEDYADFDYEKKRLVIRNFKTGEDGPSINISRVARVIDGQHRIAGLMNFHPEDEHAHFDVPVTVFVGADIADQAYIFSTVNLEQTKVSRSLAIDLYDLAKTRSPFKTCHNVAVALDRDKDGPLGERIKRLGFATEGRRFEPITQATFVDGLIPYISAEPKVDRDLLLRGKPLRLEESRRDKQVFRAMFIEERDQEIARTVSEYFYAIAKRWPIAWNSTEQGQVLNRTNGVRALLKALGHFYNAVGRPDQVVGRDAFFALLSNVDLRDRDFTVENFPPGTSGEARLRRILIGADELNVPKLV